MKTKRYYSVFILVLAFTLSASSVHSAVKIEFLDDDAFRVPAKGPVATGIFSAAGAPVLVDQVLIASLCASTSPNVVASRRNGIGAVFGVTVNTDPQNPSGWYMVPSGPTPSGWQWHDVLASSSFPMWHGKTNGLSLAQAGEKGNRIVAHLSGIGSVSEYTARIVTGLTNIAEVTFPVGKNSSGAERRFNANFFGIETGPNGVRESTYDPETNVLTQRGDDTVFSNGELPSEVVYDVWYDFGITIVVTASNVGAIDGVKNQFILGTPSLTVELMRDSDVVANKMVMAEMPGLEIHKGSSDSEGNVMNVHLLLVSGQDSVPYSVMWKNVMEDMWQVIDGFNFFKGEVAESTLAPYSSGFFQAQATMPGTISASSRSISVGNPGFRIVSKR